MRTLKHVNLFHHCEDKKEVYLAFQRDFDRDTRIQLWWEFVLGGCAVGAAAGYGSSVACTRLSARSRATLITAIATGSCMQLTGVNMSSRITLGDNLPPPALAEGATSRTHMNKEEARILHGLFYNRGIGERVSYSAGELNWLKTKSFREGAKWRGQSLESGADKHLASIGAISAAAARPLAYLQGQGYIKYGKELGWFLIEVTASGADTARKLHTFWGRTDLLSTRMGSFGLLLLRRCGYYFAGCSPKQPSPTGRHTPS